MCHFSASSYGKIIAAFIGVSLFFAPFFGGAYFLIGAIVGSGFSWFILLFGMVWIGGVSIGYLGALGSFIMNMAKIRQERTQRREFGIKSV